MIEFIGQHSIIAIIGMSVLGFLLYVVSAAFEKTASSGALVIYFYVLFLIGIGLGVNFYLGEEYVKLTATGFITAIMFYRMLFNIREVVDSN